MIWTQHDGKLFFYANEATTHQAKAISKKFPDKTIVRINQDGQELTKHLNGKRIK